MRVLFSNAPWNEINEKGHGWRGIKAGSRWPHTMPCYGQDMIGGYMPFPFFLATAGALAKRNGFDVRVRDSIAMGESYDEFYNFVKEFMPDVVIVETSTPSLYNDLKIAKHLKEINGLLKIIFTGMHFELENEEFLYANNEVDFTIYGEYEQPVNDLLISLNSGNEPAGNFNVLYRKDGTIIKNQCGPLVDLKNLPWPERDDLPYENYYDGVCGLKRPQLQMTSTRGCPFKCIFCVWPQIIYKSNKYRMRDPKDVVEEIAVNVKKHNYESIYIDDDTFNVNRKNVFEIARLMKEQGLDKIPWAIMARADLMDEGLLNALKDAGLYSLKYGVESSNQAVLDEIGKSLDLNRVKHIIQYTKDIGIKVHLTFTFGLPSDTIEGIEQTIELASSLPADTVQFSIATPFPGTKMFDIYDEKGWINSKDWRLYDGSKSAVARTERFTASQLEGYVNQAYTRWADASIRRRLNESGFHEKFKAKIEAALPNKSAKILVLQCANYGLTQELIRQLKEMSYDVHLMLHERFVERFCHLLKEDRLHVFNNTGDFKYELLKDFASTLWQNHAFDAAVVPYSNANGCGYEEVEQVARKACDGNIAAGVTLDGSIIK